MKQLTTILAFSTFVVALGPVHAANAAHRSAPDYDQSRAYSKSDGSWWCYPYCTAGTYEGRPLREWFKPDGW